MGAGLSFLSNKMNGEELPSGADLIDILLDQPPGTGSKHPLHRIAGNIERSKGSDFVFDLVRANFLVSSVDPRLNVLYQLPWKRIYTTNYDDAIEVALGVDPAKSITLDDPQSKTASGSIIHLNGFVWRVSPANLKHSLLLTDASYAASSLLDKGWLSFLEQDLKTCRTIIFAGYSLYDLDIERVLVSASSLDQKAFFFISPSADEFEIGTLAQYGTVVPGGIDTLIDKIIKIKNHYQPSPFPSGFTSLRGVGDGNYGDPSISEAQKLERQLVYGILPEQDIIDERIAFDNVPFAIVRTQELAVRNAIAESGFRDVLITGEICSGKSVTSLTMACYLRGLGYKVYYAEYGDLLSEDLRKLSTYDQKIVVIFDGYFKFRDELSDYVARRPSAHRVILTERSSTHELVGNFVHSTPGLSSIFETVLEKVTDQDAVAFEALTNFGGFWGNRAGASRGSRRRYITRNLEGSLYRLLLEIIKSEKVQVRLRELVEPISSDPEAAKLFCAALIVNSVKFPFSINEWQYLFDRLSIARIFSKYKEQVSHFLAFDSNRIYVRNGLLSTYVLHSFTDNKIIKDTLAFLYARAERASGKRWYDLKIELMKFSSIEPMFSNKNKKEQIFSYYDTIRPYGNTYNNPDYWLQLGIACTVLDDLPRGVVCFENAYAREKARPRPNLMRIDNYAARFDMVRAAATFDHAEAYDLFMSAYGKLVTQIFTDINRHYPYKTGRSFTDIAAKHYSAWSLERQEKFKAVVIEMNKKARDWRRIRKVSNVDVDILIRETQQLIDNIM